MSYVFISHADKDTLAALAIARGLEEARFATWTYKIDSVPGITYLTQTREAVERCAIFLLVLSPDAVASEQIDKEILRAFEEKKPIVPIRVGISDEDYKRARPDWKQIIGAATSMAFESDDAERCIERLIEGLERLKVERRTGGGRARIEALRRTADRHVDGKTPSPDAGAIAVERGRPHAGIPALARIRTLEFLGAVAMLGVVLALVAYVRWPSQLAVAVMEITRTGNVPESLPGDVRQGIISLLSFVNDVNVYSRAKIDFVRKQSNLTEIEAAERLHATAMVQGALDSIASDYALSLYVTGIPNGLLMRGGALDVRSDGVVDMQERAVLGLVNVLKGRVSEDDRRLVVENRPDSLSFDRFQRLSRSIDPGQSSDPPPAHPSPPPSPPRTIPAGSWNLLSPARAYAGDDDDITALIEKYRLALQAGSLEDLSTVYAEMTPPMRAALADYFKIAENLRVDFSRIELLSGKDETFASFIRDDRFTDAETHREVHLRIQVNAIVSKQTGTLKLRLVNPS